MAVESSYLFFPPTFYSPFYFAEFGSPGQDGTESQDAWGATYRDTDAFRAIRKALLTTGQFSDVMYFHLTLLGSTPFARRTG